MPMRNYGVVLAQPVTVVAACSRQAGWDRKKRAPGPGNRSGTGAISKRGGNPVAVGQQQCPGAFPWRGLKTMACVLVVEDEATLLKNVARSLQLAGFEVLTAETCERARMALKKRRIDGVCLDIGLPDGDGLDLLEEIMQSSPDIPAVVISSTSTHEARLRAARLGAQIFLSKPFRLADISAALGHCVEET